ncbi:hypothetical protein [Haloarcula sp. CBA1131]|uniref:hypothetical protein n=1 Tax=Haloarcula sp. CBA1131 TaxID=1853686 RepID=UPI0012462165|nr:hypothetical protein [Haloarcula sp. CBA1131]
MDLSLRSASHKFTEFTKRNLSIDFILLGGISICITAIVTLLSKEYGSTELGPALSRGILASTATLLTLLSYRYTVKNNIRSSLDELEPQELGEYVVVPTLYGVKWRPRLVSKFVARNRIFVQEEGNQHPLDEFFQQRTAIKFDVYSTVNGFHSVDAREFYSKYEFEKEDFSDIDSILPDEQNPNKSTGQSKYEYESNIPELAFELAAEPNFRPDGLHLTVTTTQGRHIRDISDRVLRRIVYGVGASQSKRVETDAYQKKTE